MINIQPYLDKLELLREYMFLKIDQGSNSLWVDIDYIPVVASLDILKIYQETGLILHYSGIPFEKKQLSFEEYYRSKVPLVVSYTKEIYEFIIATSSMKEDNNGRKTYNVGGDWQEIKPIKTEKEVAWDTDTK